MLSRLASLRPLAQIAARPSIAARCLSSQAGAVSQGTVKAFDARRGYGFIMPADGTEDVFVHQTQIRRAGFRFLATGEEVEFQLEVSDRGRKAINVTGKGGDILPARHMTQESREGGAPGGARRRYSRDDDA